MANELRGQGHVLGEWKPTMEGDGLETTCQRCGGLAGVGHHPEHEGRGMGVSFRDPLMSLGFCSADDPELMGRIQDDWHRRLGNVAAILIDLARSENAKKALAEQEPPAI